LLFSRDGIKIILNVYLYELKIGLINLLVNFYYNVNTFLISKLNKPDILAADIAVG
jgi:hypothetical protein